MSHEVIQASRDQSKSWGASSCFGGSEPIDGDVGKQQNRDCTYFDPNYRIGLKPLLSFLSGKGTAGIAPNSAMSRMSFFPHGARQWVSKGRGRP